MVGAWYIYPMPIYHHKCSFMAIHHNLCTVSIHGTMESVSFSTGWLGVENTVNNDKQASLLNRHVAGLNDKVSVIYRMDFDHCQMLLSCLLCIT